MDLDILARYVQNGTHRIEYFVVHHCNHSKNQRDPVVRAANGTGIQSHQSEQFRPHPYCNMKQRL